MTLMHRGPAQPLWFVALLWPLVVACVGCTEGPVNPALPSQSPNCPPGHHPYLDSCLNDVVHNPPLPQELTVTLSCTVGAHLTPTQCNASAIDERGTLMTARLSGMVWDFGDGSPQTNGALQAQHIYSHPGTFTVLVSAVDGARTGSTARAVAVP